jgi:hypothetical protein
MAHNPQMRITDITAGKDSIAVLTKITAFLSFNNEYLLISRSAINDNSPFLSVNYKTGETAPISYPVQSGLTVYTGNSGNTYAEAANRIETKVLCRLLN